MPPRLNWFDRLALWLGRIILGCVAWVLVWLALVRLVRHFFAFPVPAFLGRFIGSRWRRMLQPPDEIITHADIRPGMKVLELGPGPGTFTLEAAWRVGPVGCVVAADIEPRMIARLRTKMAQHKVDNIAPIVANVHHLPLQSKSIDRAFMVTVLAEIPDPVHALQEIRRILKPDGLLSISEFLPDPDYPRQRTVVRWCEAAGFDLAARHGNAFAYSLAFFRTRSVPSDGR